MISTVTLALPPPSRLMGFTEPAAISTPTSPEPRCRDIITSQNRMQLIFTHTTFARKVSFSSAKRALSHHPLHQASGFVSVCGSVNASNEVSTVEKERQS